MHGHVILTLLLKIENGTHIHSFNKVKMSVLVQQHLIIAKKQSFPHAASQVLHM